MSPDETQRLRGARVAVIDIETSGGSDARIIEIGVSLIERFFEAPPVVVVDTLVGPPHEIDPWAQRVHGIQAHELQDQPCWPEVWAEVRRATEGAIWCAYNASFEHRMISAELVRCGLSEPLPPVPRWLDPLRLVRHLDPAPEGAKGHHRLEAACQRRAIPHGRHRAAGDATCTAHLLRRLVLEAYQRDDVHPPPYATVAGWLAWQASLRRRRASGARRPPGQRHWRWPRG